jgi:hypothetical protein
VVEQRASHMNWVLPRKYFDHQSLLNLQETARYLEAIASM